MKAILVFIFAYLVSTELLQINDTLVIIMVFATILSLIISSSSDFIVNLMNDTRSSLSDNVASTFKDEELTKNSTINEKRTILELLASSPVYLGDVCDLTFKLPSLTYNIS